MPKEVNYILLSYDKFTIKVKKSTCHFFRFLTEYPEFLSVIDYKKVMKRRILCIK